MSWQKVFELWKEITGIDSFEETCEASKKSEKSLAGTRDIDQSHKTPINTGHNMR